MMDVHGDDYEKVVSHCLAALIRRDQPLIGHHTAKVIGALYSDGSSNALLAFVAYGSIEASRDVLMREITPAWETDETERLVLSSLARYLAAREQAGEVGPVPGWSDLWVR